ncbi:MAG: tyrosine-type recombinase/integrase [candidate division KSB1 bacterium]|nr:tyrosine-type recombinase/integrase [candidate division KSB1 bacterium]
MSRHGRFSVAPGVTIYRRFRKWWVDICREGGRVQRNLRTEDYREAVKRALDHAQNSVSLSANAVTWTKAVEAYFTEYAPLHHADKTKRLTRAVLLMFQHFMAEEFRVEDFAVDRVTRDHIEKYQRQRTVDNVSPATVNAHVRHLRAFLRWCHGKGWIAADPTRGVKMLRVVKRDMGKVLSLEEIERILEYLDRQEDTLYSDLVRLIVNTGLRFGEALHLRVEDVDPAGRRLHVRNREDHLVKDREDRVVPLNDVALGVVQRRKLLAGLDPQALLFQSRLNTPLDDRNVGHGFKARARKAGVPDANWYALRHTFATRLAESVPEMVLAALMGHSDPKTTQKFYVHRAKMNLAPPPVVGR